ncbi:hypothetical protein HDV05_005479 [Chytridiales sp. JEL 0842]|nr:hypothetical protein HDV05_005479 [Chytridiales sp. JEL 0842]
MSHHPYQPNHHHHAHPQPQLQKPGDATPLSTRLAVLKSILFVSDSPTVPSATSPQPPPSTSITSFQQQQQQQQQYLSAPSSQRGSRPLTPSTFHVPSGSSSLAASRNYHSRDSLRLTDYADDSSNSKLTNGASASRNSVVNLTGASSEDALSVTGTESSRSLFAKLSFGKSSTNSSGVDPPQVAKRQEPTQYGLGLAKHVGYIFGMSESEVNSAINGILEDGHSADYVYNDIINYIHLLDNNLSTLVPSSFAPPQSYSAYQTSERQEALQRHGFSTNLPQLSIPLVTLMETAGSGTLVTLSIPQANGLLAKEKQGYSNPYVVVSTLDGLTFQSEVVKSNLNPSWRLSVTLLIRDPSLPITFAVWSKTNTDITSKSFSLSNNLATDPFLGMVTLTGAQLIADTQQAGGVSERWVKLEKRSAKSNVAGNLRVRVERTVQEHLPPHRLYELTFKCIPSQPLEAFRAVLSSCVESDVKMFNRGEPTRRLLSEPSVLLLDELVALWRIDIVAKAAIQYDVFAQFYTTGSISAGTLYTNAYTYVTDMMTAASKCFRLPEHAIQTFKYTSNTLSNLITQHLSTFFNQPAPSLGPSAAQEFFYQTKLIDALTLHPLLCPTTPTETPFSLASRLVSLSFNGRFHGLNALAGTPVMVQTGSGVKEVPVSPSQHLMTLVDDIYSELDSLNRCFDELYFGKLHIPTIGARIFLENILPHLDGFALRYATAEPDLEEAFHLYHAVRRLEGLYEQIDFSVPLENKISEWVNNAVKLDDFTLLEAGHSSSVLDIFTSFQQQLDFLLKIRWPDDDEMGIFIDRLLENFCDGLEQYTGMLKRGILRELTSNTSSTSASRQPPGSGGKSKKFKLKLRKEGPPVDASEIRISLKAGVQMTDLEAVIQRMEELVRRVPERFRRRAPPPPIPTQSPTSPSSKVNHPPPPVVLPTSNRPLPPPPSSVTTPTSGPIDRPLPALPPRPTHSTPQNPHPPLGTHFARYPTRITFFSATDLPMVRPFTTEIYLTLSSPALNGREVAKSRKVPQYRSMWNEKVACVLTEREVQVGLMVSLIQVLPDKSLEEGAAPGVAGGVMSGVTGSLGGGEFVVGSAQFSVDIGLCESNGGVVVNVAGGKILLKVEVAKWEAIDIVQERILYVNERCIDDMMDKLVLKICHDLRTRLKDLSAHQKKSVVLMNNITSAISKNSKSLLSSFKSTHTSSNQPTQPTTFSSSSSALPTEDQVHAQLSPLLSFLDANLGAIAEAMPDSLSRRIVARLWERVMEVGMSLLVPSLGYDDKEKKAWEEGRVAFLKFTIEIIKSFFYSDGDGVPLHVLDSTDAYTSLKSIIQYYDHKHPQSLIQLHQSLLETSMKTGILVIPASIRVGREGMGNQGGGGEVVDEEEVGGWFYDGSEHDWLLRLIKLRGGRDYVEAVLFARCGKRTN